MDVVVVDVVVVVLEVVVEVVETVVLDAVEVGAAPEISP